MNSSNTKAPYFYYKDIIIYNCDFLKLSHISESSIDLIITSPPYNVDIKYNSHEDNMSYYDYLEFSKKWIHKCFLLAKEDGRFCLNVPLDKIKVDSNLFVRI